MVAATRPLHFDSSGAGASGRGLMAKPSYGLQGAVDPGVIDVEMGHGSHGARVQGPHADPLGLEPAAEIVGVGDAEDHDVRLHQRGIELDPRKPGEALRQAAGARVIVPEALDVVIERVEGRGGDYSGLAQGPAEHLLPPPGLRDEVVGAGQTGADRRSQALAEVDPGRVEGRRPLTGSHPAGRYGIQQPGAVEVRAEFVARATSSTPSTRSWGQTVPPERLAVCSTQTRRGRGA